jgi:hypothetical protein
LSLLLHNIFSETCIGCTKACLNLKWIKRFWS